MDRPSLLEVRAKHRLLRQSMIDINRVAPNVWDTMPEVKDNMYIILNTLDWVLEGKGHILEAIENVAKAAKSAREIERTS